MNFGGSLIEFIEQTPNDKILALVNGYEINKIIEALKQLDKTLYLVIILL